MLKTKVKASSVSNLTDARYFAAWGVDWLGFNFDEGSEFFIQPQQMRAIKEWVDGVKIVGEFSYHSTQDIKTAIQLLDLDAIQVGPFTTVEQLQELAGSLPIIHEIIVDAQSSEQDLLLKLQAKTAYVDSFLLNFDKNGIKWENILSEKKLSNSILSSICETFPVIISIELAPSSLNEFLEIINPKGINLFGGEEEKTGFKSFDELDEIFEMLEILE